MSTTKTMKTTDHSRRDIVARAISDIESGCFKLLSHSGYIQPPPLSDEAVYVAFVSEVDGRHETGVNYPLRDADIDLILSYCTVCVLGALVLTKARLRHNTYWYDMAPTGMFAVPRATVIRLLHPEFARQEIELISHAFEVDLDTPAHACLSTRPVDRAKMLGLSFDDDADRAIGILTNLLQYGKLLPDLS